MVKNEKMKDAVGAICVAIFVTFSLFVFGSLRYFNSDLYTSSGNSIPVAMLDACRKLAQHTRLILVFVAFLVLVAVVAFFYFQHRKAVNKFVFKHRYLFALGVLTVCVLLDLNGSSIGEWAGALPQGSNSGLIFGKPRGCRTDEFALFTGMTFAQFYDPQGQWPFLGQVMGATTTNMFMVYGQPVLDPSIIVHPFQIGFLVLGLSRGLSFFWCSRAIALFMTSFELGRIITKDNRALSVAFACLTALAPAVAWWFSINSLVEMLVFFNIIIVCLSKYSSEENVAKRRTLIAVCAYSCLSFVFSIYPAWQVPLAYILLALIIAIIVQNKAPFLKRLKEDWVAVAICAVVAILGAVAIALHSWDAIVTEMNTDYPGDRIDAGGGYLFLLFRFPISLFLPFIPSSAASGLSTGLPDALTAFFDFCPLGVVLAIYNYRHEKKLNQISVALVIVILFLGIYESVGFPEIVAKLTLMGKTIPTRAIVIFSFANLILLFHELARFKPAHIEAAKGKAGVVISGLTSAVACGVLCKLNDEIFIGAAKLIIIIAVLACVWLAVFLDKKRVFVTSCVVVAVVCGAFVNPIQRGIAVVDENPLITQIRTISQENKGAKWVSAVGWRSNITLFAGAPAINSTNIYPNEELWKVLDPSGERKAEWNRYAHLPCKIVSESEGSSFANTSLDSVALKLTLTDLKKLDVEYVVADQDEMSLTDEEMQQLEVVSAFGTITIYRLR